MKTALIVFYAFFICGGVLFPLVVLRFYRDYREAARWHRKRTETYRKHLEQSEESLRQTRKSNRLRSKEIVLLRELIAELRTTRQPPDPPPISP